MKMARQRQQQQQQQHQQQIKHRQDRIFCTLSFLWSSRIVPRTHAQKTATTTTRTGVHYFWLLFCWLYLPLLSSTHRGAAASLFFGETAPVVENRLPSYMVCNGAIEQMMLHAAHIAALHLQLYETPAAAALRREPTNDKTKDLDNTNRNVIRIPNIFIYHLSPTEKDKTTTITLPTIQNSVPLERVLDTTLFLQNLQQKWNIQAKMDVTLLQQKTNVAQENEQLQQDEEDTGPPPVPQHDPSYYQDYVNNMPCRDVTEMLQLVSRHESASYLMLDILSEMQPGGIAEQWVEFILKEMPDGHHDHGICVQHNYGPSWHAQCREYAKQTKKHELTNLGIDRSNCDWMISSSTTDVHQAPNKLMTLEDNNEFTDDTFGKFEDEIVDPHNPNSKNADFVQKMRSKYAGGDVWVRNALRYRGIQPSSHGSMDSGASENFVYYVGLAANAEEAANNRHNIPPALEYGTEHQVFGHAEFWASTRHIHPRYSVGKGHEPAGVGMFGLLGDSDTATGSAETGRDNAEFWILVDYFICREMRNFIGNSVSEFSAVQIATRWTATGRPESRHSGRAGVSAYWYNSQNVPLAKIWKHALEIPVVYTFSEESPQAPTNKMLLQTSISSLRQHMPRVSITLLYHGFKDTGFLKWLQQDMDVLVHEHNPFWEERLGQSVTDKSTFDQWLRLDIPLYMETEYCLYLSAHTIVAKAIDVMGQGTTLTRGLSMSTDMNPQGTEPLDGGVTVMNIPYLRQTYRQFKNFVIKERNFVGQLSGHDGAYVSFYNQRVNLMPTLFSAKPYWPREIVKSAQIVHFNGPSAADYIRNILGQPCSGGLAPTQDEYLCVQGIETLSSGVCSSLGLLSQYILNIREYCKVSFAIPKVGLLQAEAETQFCEGLLASLVPSNLSRFWSQGNMTTDPCDKFTQVIEQTLLLIPVDLPIPRKEIAQRFGFYKEPVKMTEMKTPPGAMLVQSLGTTVVGSIILAYLWHNWYCSKRRNYKSSKALMVCLGTATFIWLVLSFVVFPIWWTILLS